jgi:S-(hydroxymethyl)glutathione dehydrogenase / alcohol dehydrogenase
MLRRPPRKMQGYQGKLLLDEMITRRFRLDQVDEAFQAMREGEVIRSVLMFD